VGIKFKHQDAELEGVAQQLNDLALGIPNIPDAACPVGLEATDNRELKNGRTTEFGLSLKTMLI